MKTHVEELTGNALIWATCEALGHAPVVADTGIAYRADSGAWVYPRYTDDCEAGELMASEWIGVGRPIKGQNPPVWRAVTDIKIALNPARFDQVVSAFGETLGDAVCRALVLSRLGKTVDVPDQLLSNKSAQRPAMPDAALKIERLLQYIDAMHGQGRVRHIYAGLCPDESQPHSRDDECPACRLLAPDDGGSARP